MMGRETYYVRTGDNNEPWRPIQGENVPIHPFDEEFFAHRDEVFPKLWKIGHGRTGQAITAGYSTKRRAVEQARVMIDRAGVEVFVARCRAKEAEYGVSPRYAPQEATDAR